MQIILNKEEVAIIIKALTTEIIARKVEGESTKKIEDLWDRFYPYVQDR